MKMSHVFKKAMHNMQPGKIIKSGFLGVDQRPLPDIIAHDEEIMGKLNLDFDTMVSKMRYLMEEAKKGLGEPITIDNKWLLKIDEARGRLPSPFEDGLFKKINVSVENIHSQKHIIYSELSLHLIEKHHFFQGKGSVYRLEPADIKEVLEL